MNIKSNKGNALFLILIAVALFAALSYAVTQSGRGGGSISNEESLLELSRYNQEISLIRNAVTKMRLFDGIDITNIRFCTGANTECPNHSICTTGTDCVFSPTGGEIDSSRLTSLANGSFFFHEAGGTFSLSGSSANTLFIRRELKESGDNFNLYECSSFNEEFGLSSTVLKEATANPVFADGHASLQGEWEFCIDANTGAGNTYMPHWIISTQN